MIMNCVHSSQLKLFFSQSNGYVSGLIVNIVFGYGYRENLLVQKLELCSLLRATLLFFYMHSFVPEFTCYCQFDQLFLLNIRSWSKPKFLHIKIRQLSGVLLYIKINTYIDCGLLFLSYFQVLSQTLEQLIADHPPEINYQ